MRRSVVKRWGPRPRRPKLLVCNVLRDRNGSGQLAAASYSPHDHEDGRWPCPFGSDTNPARPPHSSITTA